MKFCTLGSGSSGNATWVGGSQGSVLIDAGLSAKVICERMCSLGLDPQQLQGIFVTHEHSDHWKGAAKLSKDIGATVYSGQGTFEVLKTKWGSDLNFKAVKENDTFQMAGLTVRATGVCHDAAEPYCYSVSDGTSRMAVITDLGQLDDRIVDVVKRLDALVFEANYDKEMLQRSPYPASLKKRISGGYGHLANDIAAKFLSKHLDERCQLVLMAHLSENANSPYVALQTYRHYLMPLLKKNLNLGIAPRHQTSGLLNVTPLDMAQDMTLPPLKNSA